MNNMYKKVSIEEELPPMDEFVTCFYDSGETMVYKRYETGITSVVGSGIIDVTTNQAIQKEWAWTMRDGIADRTPKEGKITHWLKEEVPMGFMAPRPLNLLTLNNDIQDVEIYIDGISVIIPKMLLKEMIGQYIYPTKTN